MGYFIYIKKDSLMLDVTLVLLCAGSSQRFGKSVKKQWLRIENEPLWLFVTNRLVDFYRFKDVVIVSSSDEVNYMKNYTDYKIIEGGKTRQQSLKNAVNVVDTTYVLVTDVARSCLNKEMMLRVLGSKSKADCVVPFVKVADTVVLDRLAVERDDIKLIQTPQLSRVKVLKKALKNDIEFTDDSSAIASIGGKVVYVEGSSDAEKLTFSENLEKLKCLKKPSKDFFVGQGFDVHEFEDKRDMFLGGVKIDVPFGFKAHSDGDVLIHSLIDALLGAIGAGDIGELFPDSDNEYKNIDSTILLKKVVTFLHNVGFEVVNIDVTIIAQTPKLLEYKHKIREKLSNLLQIEKIRANIKATTTEKLGFVGRKEGVAVMSVAQVKYFNWLKK